MSTLSDLKLKGLTLADRRLLEAIYCDFQVDSRAPLSSLNLAGPVLTLLRSIVRQRTGQDPDAWSTMKVQHATMGLKSMAQHTIPIATASAAATTTTSSSSSSSSSSFSSSSTTMPTSAALTKRTFEPTKGIFYFATSRNKYKVMGRTKVMDCLKDSRNGQSDSKSDSTTTTSSSRLDIRLNSHSLPQTVQAARIDLFRSTHPAASMWKGIFQKEDFNTRLQPKAARAARAEPAAATAAAAARRSIPTSQQEEVFTVPRRSPFTLHHRPYGQTVVKVNVDGGNVSDVMMMGQPPQMQPPQKRTRVRLRACDGCPHNAKRRKNGGNACTDCPTLAGMTQQFGAQTRLDRRMEEFHIEDFVVYEDEEEEELANKFHKRSGSVGSVSSNQSNDNCPLLALLDDLEDLVLPDTPASQQQYSMMESGGSSTMMKAMHNIPSSSFSALSSSSYGKKQGEKEAESLQAKDVNHKAHLVGPPRSRPRVPIAYDNL